ncbi:EAL domain-containing protein [Alcaligenaceae bacterium A4P071]|nr:EAL domain-containing protein [Alcaligenaceae bacterium B3P038]MDQ2149793.1 EAL domain-containing protein [Alcaligenaceae bacterium C4P045]MDQ2184124.1 EAL domain-containing protein [Alcaligenaceae bacterium A4P071]
MLDTFTLLVIAVLQFEVIGFALLLAWFLSRRARIFLGLSGSVMIAMAFVLLPLWYLWDSGQFYFAAFSASLVTAIVAVPTALILLLVYYLVRAEGVLRALRISGRRQEAVGLAHLADTEDLEDDLRRAMQEAGQLYVVYQPIYGVDGRQLRGFEALVRWNHPQRGLVAPMQFIPVAEQTELIVPLGAWVLETACAEAASWPEPWYISVNISPIQLERHSLLRDVRGALDRSGLPPERLELEVTEGVMVAAEGGEISRLSELRRAGVKIAIDDFGTGYSSLGYLQELPFDTIKIDRSFIRNLESDSNAQAIVGTVVDLSRRLEREIVAEGVETEGQYSILSELKCHRVQGWLLGKPMSALELAERYIQKTLSSSDVPDIAWAQHA